MNILYVSLVLSSEEEQTPSHLLVSLPHWALGCFLSHTHSFENDLLQNILEKPTNAPENNSRVVLEKTYGVLYLI